MKLKIHPFTYLVIFLSLMFGLFKELLVFIYIIIFHELGHILLAIYFKWEIDEVILEPFGALTVFKTDLNKPIKEELIILLAGPIFQIINFLIFKDKLPYFNYYNYGLFIFNMLPIYPLDGYKLLNLILCRFIPFKRSIRISLLISFLSLIFIFKFDLIYIVIFLLLLKGAVFQYNDIDSIYNKFLYERYNKKIYFKKLRKVSDISLFYKDYRHLINKNGIYTEKEMLEKRFKR